MAEKVKYVYAIASTTGPIKIGFSGNPKKRMKELRNAKWGPLTLLNQWQHNAPRRVEYRAHGLLWDRCVEPEWFNVSPSEACEAVMKAIEATEPVYEPAPKPPPEPVPNPLLFKVRLPAIPENSDAVFGYARPIEGVPASVQDHWLRKAGVGPDDIFTDKGAVLRAACEGDIIVVWSRKVLGTAAEAAATERQLIERGCVYLYVKPPISRKGATL